ncbi:MAG TPA: tRNA lysidine(34) synthetase TilS [Solirubrobacter sp.]|nr:tRNA lysidine(34) synthetase TilS [Solirubrobacter sp.]
MIVVLFSGGRDSTCLLHLMAQRGEPVTALHVNYGLRPEADEDEAHCVAMCERLGVPLRVHRAGKPRGNVQAWAREVRYAEAHKLAGLIAVAHTATDQAETVIYRLLTSPGRRALLGMPERSGRVIRPLLHMTRAETAAYCREHGLPWREDPSNPTTARGRIREILDLHPAAEANVARTLAQLRDEAEVLDLAVDAAMDADLTTLPPPLARLVLQRMAGDVPIGAHADAILALARKGGTASLDLPGGLRATSEYGRVTIERPRATSTPEPAWLTVPGEARFGDGVVTCRVGEGELTGLASPLEVRAWRAGDRMRPAGLGGTKSLQDLFTDRKIPRARRHTLPVVVSDGEIAWVPGVATGERFRATDESQQRVRLDWRRL